MTHPATTKRIVDVIGASLLLIMLSPLLLTGCLAVLVSMGRPILFLQRRSGKDGAPFQVFKLRTMTADSSDGKNDEMRVTPCGLLLRKFSIDEIPQLLNVLGGSMSLVGPRPLLPEYDDRYSARQARRLELKPGLTGLAQITGRNELSWDEKLELDVRYVETQSIWLDMAIMLKTPMVVLTASGFRRAGEARKFGE
ncbi:MAG: sugar transferase [Candidatus Puniceispirillaceae bacterium]